MGQPREPVVVRVLRRAGELVFALWLLFVACAGYHCLSGGMVLSAAAFAFGGTAVVAVMIEVGWWFDRVVKKYETGP